MMGGWVSGLERPAAVLRVRVSYRSKIRLLSKQEGGRANRLSRPR